MKDVRKEIMAFNWKMQPVVGKMLTGFSQMGWLQAANMISQKDTPPWLWKKLAKR